MNAKTSTVLRVVTLATLFFLLYSFNCNVFAQSVSKLDGWCENGGKTVSIAGSTSTTKVQRTVTGCTVTVYDTGTTNLSTIYEDSSLTPKANPFTADTSNGYWYFYGVQGNRVDVQFSSGISPNNYPSPFTRGDLLIPGGGSGGGNASACVGATSGRIAKFTNSTTLCNSLLTESGTTISLPGQFDITQSDLATAALSVRAASSATGNVIDAKDSSGSARFSILPSGAISVQSYTSSGPAVSASGRATIYYDDQGGSLDNTLTLSRNGGSYQFFITAATDGTAGQCLQTDGAKTFSFGACGSSLSLPSEQIAFGTGAGVSSSSQLKYTTASGAVKIGPFGTSAGNTGTTDYLELVANGTDAFKVRGPDALASSRTMVFPSDDPIAGDGLKVTSFTGGVITTEWGTFGAGSCPPGDSTTKQVLYNLSAACKGAVEFEYQAAASPNVFIRAQDPSYVALQLKFNNAAPTQDIFQVKDNSSNTNFAISSAGTPYTPTLSGSATGMRAGLGAFANLTGAAYGDNSNSTLRSVALGDSANASAVESVAIGNSTGANHSQSICIGYDCSTFGTNQLVFGSRQAQANNVYFGAGGDETLGGTSQVILNGSRPNNNNYPGGDIIIASGLNRGTGLGTSSPNSQASVRLQTSTLDGTSGSSQGVLVDRYIANGLKKVITTNNVATNLFEISLPTLRGTSGVVYIQVHVESATDVQELFAEVSFASVNKGGVYTSTVTAEHTRTALSTGTLTITPALTSGTDKVTFSIQPNSSLTFSAARYWISYTLIHNSEQAVTQL